MEISSESNIAENKVVEQFSPILYVLNCLMGKYDLVFTIVPSAVGLQCHSQFVSQFSLYEYPNAYFLVCVLMRINKLKVRETVRTSERRTSKQALCILYYNKYLGRKRRRERLVYRIFVTITAQQQQH